MQEIARYECVYHRNSKDFTDKNKKANCWDKIGQKFNLSAGEVEANFRNIYKNCVRSLWNPKPMFSTTSPHEKQKK